MHIVSRSLYLAAATYISSRAFPSSVLSQTPQLPNLDNDDDAPSEPVLLPGVDILNHARGQPVTWISHTKPQARVERVAIVAHDPTPAGQEIFNNYGPKPNAELLLGYGFTLPNNPDDTIILKLGGVNGRKWSVGRGARGIEGLWAEILVAVGGNSDSEADGDFENVLDASGALGEMVSSMYGSLPAVDAVAGKEGIRAQVVQMYGHYVEGTTVTQASRIPLSDRWQVNARYWSPWPSMHRKRRRTRSSWRTAKGWSWFWKIELYLVLCGNVHISDFLSKR